jgi:serine/threonine protein kinase/N-acetylneuraminic acid mutarotase
MFGNWNEILQLHTDFAKAISDRVNHWNYSSSIAEIFQQYIPQMKIYSSFINTFDKGEVLISDLTKIAKTNDSKDKASTAMANKFLELCQQFAALPESHGLPMGAFRINPVQRLPRLCLLLEDLLRNTIERHPDFSGVRDCLAMLKDVSLAVNAAKGAAIMQEQAESIAKRLTGWSNGAAKACKAPLLQKTRHLVIEETYMLLLGPVRMAQVSLALFSDGVLIAKRSSDKPDKQLEFMEWVSLRGATVAKIGTKQVLKISKEWKSVSQLDENLESLHWLQLTVNEQETFLLGVSELKFWHDWPSKFRSTLSNLRSKYWSTISSINGHSPPPCAYGTLTFYSPNNSFVYYGGISNKLLNSFFSYNLSTRQWMSIAPVGGVPPALAKHSATLVGSKIWFYGGLVKNTVTVSSEMYTYDIPSNTWAGPLEMQDAPKGRAGHTMTGPIGSKLYLLGGSWFDEKKQEVILDDMHEFDTKTLKWTALNKAPIARHGHVAAALEGKLFAWGGKSPGGEFSASVSVYDFAVRDWTEALNLTGFVPAPRQWVSGASVQGRHLLVVGGKREALYNDIYLLDVNAETWCKYSLPCVLDHKMSASLQVVENPKTGISVYLFGGLQLQETMDSTTYSDQFVTFQLHNKYIQQTASNIPPTHLKSSFAIPDTTTLTSAAAISQFNFVSKISQPTGTAAVEKTESSASLCTLQRLLSAESKFGETWQAVHTRTHIPFAAKTIKKPSSRPDFSADFAKLSRAVETASKVKGSALTTYMGIMDQPNDSFWILSEFCKHGSVHNYLASGNKLREPQLQLLATVMISALQSLHSAGLVHGNLKASNVLLNDSLEFKVADYAIGRALESLVKPTSVWQAWDAPEVLLGGSPSFKSDVFALGVTIIEMAEFSPPHKTLSRGKRWSAAMEDFVNKATTENDNRRPDLDTLANHPWIKSAKVPEKLQLDLADAMKKVYAKEFKRRSAAPSVSMPSASSSPASHFPTSTSLAPGSSGKRPISEKKSSADKLEANLSEGNGSSATSDADEVVTLKAKNSVLRKKLRLLKRAYEQLGMENSKLRELLEQNSIDTSSTLISSSSSSSLAPSLKSKDSMAALKQTSGEIATSEIPETSSDDNAASPSSPGSDTPLTSSVGSGKVKRHLTKNSSGGSPAREKRKSLIKVTDVPPKSDS